MSAYIYTLYFSLSVSLHIYTYSTIYSFNLTIINPVFYFFVFYFYSIYYGYLILPPGGSLYFILSNHYNTVYYSLYNT